MHARVRLITVLMACWIATAAGVYAATPVSASVSGAECTIVGTNGDDFLKGTNDDDVICGLGGDDIIVGRGGEDALYGGSGDDVLVTDASDTTVDGGRGDDQELPTALAAGVAYTSQYVGLAGAKLELTFDKTSSVCIQRPMQHFETTIGSDPQAVVAISELFQFTMGCYARTDTMNGDWQVQITTPDGVVRSGNLNVTIRWQRGDGTKFFTSTSGLSGIDSSGGEAALLRPYEVSADFGPVGGTE